MKLYYQVGFRDLEGDVVIHQYHEVQLPSGIVLPKHISTVSVESQISTEVIIEAMGHEFHYEPDPTEYGFAEVTEARKELRFCIEPQDRRAFCELSSHAIADAFRALTFCDVTPKINFETTQQATEIEDDDREMLQAVVQNVNDIVNDVDRTPVAGGLYL